MARSAAIKVIIEDMMGGSILGFGAGWMFRAALGGEINGDLDELLRAKIFGD